MNYVGSSIHPETKEELINYERLNILIEAYQFYPLIVRRDKNMSTSIY